MTLLNSGYHCHDSPYIIAAWPHPVTGPWTNGQAAAEQTIPSSVGTVEGERGMLNVPLHRVIDTKPLVYRRR